MYLARKMTDNSLHTIGLAFGRDYSTVIHSVKKIEITISEDPEFLKLVNRLKDNLSHMGDGYLP